MKEAGRLLCFCDAVDRSEQFVLVEHTTFSVSDNPELRLIVFLATAASNSIAKMKKIVAAFGKGASSTPSRARRLVRGPAIAG
jgi:hypothetical protein